MNWWTPVSSRDIAPVPWLHPAVVLYMERFLGPGARVLEHGSGGSTLYFATRVKFVVSVEDDMDWYAVVKKQAPANVELHVANDTYPEALKGKGFDLLLIDGEPLSDRAKWLDAAPELVRPGGVVVLDNANQEAYSRERNGMKARAQHWVSFEVNPPSHHFCVTDFYRMKGGHDDESWI